MVKSSRICIQFRTLINIFHLIPRGINQHSVGVIGDSDSKLSFINIGDVAEFHAKGPIKFRERPSQVHS